MGNIYDEESYYVCFFSDNGTLPKKNLYITYIAFYVYYVVVCFIIGIKAMWNLRSILKHTILNVYQAIQYAVLILYLILSLLHVSMKFETKYEFHNNGIANFVFFIFLMSEVINISCWVNLLIHIKACVKALAPPQKARFDVDVELVRVRRTEKIVFAFVLTF